jgi:hypothetical protein
MRASGSYDLLNPGQGDCVPHDLAGRLVVRVPQSAAPGVAEREHTGRAHLCHEHGDPAGGFRVGGHRRVWKVEESRFDSEDLARDPARLHAALDHFGGGYGPEGFGHLAAGQPAKHNAVPASPLSEHRGDRANFVIGVSQHYEKRLPVFAPGCRQLTPVC